MGAEAHGGRRLFPRRIWYSCSRLLPMPPLVSRMSFTSESPVRVLYRDEDLLVMDKPSGLAVHRGWAEDRVTALSLARRITRRRVYPVHRLDRGTSGVLVFALRQAVASALGEELRESRVEKRYLAIVRGRAPERAVVDRPLAAHKGGAELESVTEIRRLRVESLDVDAWRERQAAKPSRWPDGSNVYSLVEAAPRTGRLHQIRRHLKHLRHPVVGDTTHGDGKHNRLFRDAFGMHRLALHAVALRFVHPSTEELLRLAAPWPADLPELFDPGRDYWRGSSAA
jgi:tRNA pseudouridine65 synthase